MSFKERFVRRKFEKELALTPDTRTPNDKKVYNVGILTTDKFSSYFSVAESVPATLKSVRNVHMFSFRKFSKADDKSYKHFSEKDFNWKAKVIDPSLETFLDTPFDLLIGFYNKRSLYLELATLKSKAAFKVGFADVNDALFDLVIAEKPENIKSFNSEIHKYLELLQKV